MALWTVDFSEAITFFGVAGLALLGAYVARKGIRLGLSIVSK
jgi:hypothetical protein